MAKTPEMDLRENFSTNHIINGNLDFWQRGVSTLNVTGAFLPDRFGYFADVIAADLSQQTDVPANGISAFSFRISRNTSATPTSTQVGYIRYTLEGHDLRAIKSKTVTLSFWVKSTKTGTYSINLRNGGFTRAYTATYTISAANTWEYKTITFTHSDVGTWDYTNLAGLKIHWVVFAGSTYQTSNLNQWVNSTSSDNWASTSQVNLWDSVNANFNITQIQLTEGPQDLPFRRAGKTISDELSLCQRYYEKSYSLTVPPATVTQDGMWSHAYGGGAQTIRITSPFKTRKRIASTSVVVYNPQTGAAQSVAKDVSANVAISFSLGNETHWGYEVPLPAGDPRVYAHFTADAEL